MHCCLSAHRPPPSASLFLFNATPPTAIYTLSLHDDLPISRLQPTEAQTQPCQLGMDLAQGARFEHRQQASPGIEDRDGERSGTFTGRDGIPGLEANVEHTGQRLDRKSVV